MENVVTLGKWLRRGSQRSAIAQALRKPMIASEICEGARRINPHIQLRDLWLILPQLRKRKLVSCHVRNRVSGALYSLTDLGRAAVAAEFGLHHPPAPRSVAWQHYSWVARARSRRRVLSGLAQWTARTEAPATATALRQFLRREHSLGLNVVLRTLQDSVSRRLVRCLGENELGRRLYQLSPMGVCLVRLLNEN